MKIDNNAYKHPPKRLVYSDVDKINVLLQQKLVIDTEDGWRARDPPSGEAVSSDTALGKEALEIIAEFLDDSNDEWFEYELAMRDEESHPNGELVRDDLF